MFAGRGNFQGALGRELAANFGEVRGVRRLCEIRGVRGLREVRGTRNSRRYRLAIEGGARLKTVLTSLRVPTRFRVLTSMCFTATGR
jgi:hypothetical protein